MSAGKEPRNYSSYQQKVIKRYYNEQPTILRDRLAQLVGDLYLAQGKSRARLWKQAADAMQKLGLSADRIEHVVNSDKPEILALVVKELN